MLRQQRRALSTLIILFLLLATATTAAAQQRGKASYYSKRAHGARSSSGIRLHNDSLFCAHRTHPFGTLLLVRNVSNGKEVVVKVVDRGPFGRGRIIDLSPAAAKALNMLSAGVAVVEISVYNESHAPFVQPQTGLPEIDFGLPEDDDTDALTPHWKNSKAGETTHKQQDHGETTHKPTALHDTTDVRHDTTAHAKAVTARRTSTTASTAKRRRTAVKSTKKNRRRKK